MSTVLIKDISIADALPIRQQVMYPDDPIDSVKLELDHLGKHMGVIVDDQIISIISLFQVNHEMQFRKFATLHSYQRQGYGSQLLNWVIDYAKESMCQRLWCNARLMKSAFYEKFGFNMTGPTWTKNEIEFGIMERKMCPEVMTH